MKIPKSEYVTIKIKVHQCPENGAEWALMDSYAQRKKASNDG